MEKLGIDWPEEKKSKTEIETSKNTSLEEKKEEVNEEEKKIDDEKLEKEKKDKFKHLPSEDEVKKFVKHVNYRLNAVEVIIGLLIVFVIGYQF